MFSWMCAISALNEPSESRSTFQMSELWAQTQIKWWTMHFVEKMVSEEKTSFDYQVSQITPHASVENCCQHFGGELIVISV